MKFMQWPAIRRAGRMAGGMICFGITVFSWVSVSVAGELYQWRDSSGVVHFTDNPSNVPTQYRDAGPREIKPLAGISSGGEGGGTGDVGGKVWKEKCQSCHLYNTDDTVAGQRGILSSIVNPTTKFPYPESSIVQSIRSAANGTGEGMPVININDDELKALAKFLIGKVSSH